MSTILIYTSPARGHLYPMMDVAIALRDRGHRVVVQTLASERDAVTREGIEHRAIAAAIEALPVTDYEGGSPIAKLKSVLATWLERAEFEVEDLRAARSDLDPDLIVADANTFGAAAFAEAEGRPWAMFLPYVLPVPSPDTPAFGPGFAPPRNGLERLRDRIVWTVMNLGIRREIQGVDRLRRRLGASPIRSHADMFQRADVLLYRTAEPFEYPRRMWHPSVKAIGPGLWSPAGERPAWLDDLPRPRVLVNVSTEYQADDAIVEAALAGLADEPGSLIVTTSAIDSSTFTVPNERVRIERFLPHAEVVPHVDAMVTHGGMGSTQRALAAGVPVCVVPWGRDQSETARRVDHSGGGVMLPPGRLTPDSLRDAVRTTLGKKMQAREIADAFAEAGGAARAVELLEGLLDAPSRRASSPENCRVTPTDSRVAQPVL